jgi:hypothetical protein
MFQKRGVKLLAWLEGLDALGERSVNVVCAPVPAPAVPNAARTLTQQKQREQHEVVKKRKIAEANQ